MLDSAAWRGEGTELDELNYKSLVEMAKMVRARKISPVELANAHLERIERLNPKLNAIVSMDAGRVRAQAKAAEKAAGSRSKKGQLGPLHGVPVTIKSSIDVKGERCECGTALRKGLIPERDAPLVARLRAAGAIILGTTNVPEFLMAYESDNSLYGRSNNPWGLGRTPGGSSGGEAAAIASGCSAGGVGSDGGGSVRIPAHFVGICGLKPTPGRIPSTGHFPASAGPFVNLGVVGPMARTVGDLERLFEVIAGPDTGDPASAPVPLRKWSDAEIRKLRIGYFEDDGATPVTAETAAVVRAAVEALRQQGFKVEPWRPENLDRVWQLWWNLFGRAIHMAMTPMVAGREAELSPMYRAYRESLASEKPLSAGELLETQVVRDVLRNAFLARMEKYPILLCPACAIPAFRHREHQWEIRGRKVEILKAMSYSQWFNLLSNPGAVVPVGKSPEGLPIGVQIVGRPWEEEAVLAVAAKIERACGGFRRPPV
jgi:Asp-tRNA(Asn)/Glu-tRNA(Gln) amidotransferase A subunit family amidase